VPGPSPSGYTLPADTSVTCGRGAIALRNPSRPEVPMRGKQLVITAAVALAVVLGVKAYESKRG
jgi:hypothetical protein